MDGAFTLQCAWVCFLLWLCCLFSSCTTAHKASKYYDKNRPKALDYCFTRFPPKDSIHEVVRYEEGELRIDTVDNTHVDTIVNTVTNEKEVIKYKTITKTKTDTVYTDKFITQTDTKAQELLQNAKQLIIAKDKQLHNRTRIVFWLGMSWPLFILGILVRALWFNRVNRG